MNVKFHNKKITMEIDTGAATSIIGIRTYKKLFTDLKLQQPNVRLRTCTGQEVPVE